MISVLGLSVREAERRLAAEGVCAVLTEVRSRKGSRPICSGCGQAGPGYDTLARAKGAGGVE